MEKIKISIMTKIIKRLNWKISTKYVQPVCGTIYGRTVLIAQIIHHFCCCFTGCKRVRVNDCMVIIGIDTGQRWINNPTILH